MTPLQRISPLPLLALLAIGCGEGITPTDGDGDGYTLSDGDCWDTTEGPSDSDLTGADIHPDAAETWYDGVDQDCAGDDDDDADGDGYASENTGGDDCDDNDDSINPGATDSWYDGVDQDCAGDDDDDADGDGYASEDVGGDDCDDNDDSVNPGATDTWYDGVDQDCGNEDDYDKDRDGFASEDAGGDDCDDDDESINPGAEEICGDGIDQDCEPENCPGLSGTFDVSSSITRISGEEEDAYFGCSIATLGDWNNDNYSEILIGSYGSLGATGSTENGGAAFVFSTPLSTHTTVDTASMQGYTSQNDQWAGYAVSSAAGFDGTGALNFMLSMPAWDNFAGVVVMYEEGLAGTVALDFNDYIGVVVSEDEGDWFGHDVISIGDSDDDGYGEILIGAYQAAEAAPLLHGVEGGAVYLFDGPYVDDDAALPFGYPYNADTIFYAQDAYDQLGYSVAGVSDVNGDGLSDWLMGAPYADDNGEDYGSAYLFFGPHSTGQSVPASSADVIFVGGEQYSGFGGALAEYGDVNGDGYGDVGVTAQYTDGLTAGEGAVYVYENVFSSATNPIGPSSASYRIAGAADNYDGTAMAFVDLDGDDLDDIVYSGGAWIGNGSGRVRVVYASNGGGDFDSAEADVIIAGEYADDQLGGSLVNAGDQTGDGISDLLIGAPYAYGSGLNAGAVYLFSGAAPGD
jgi:hypothetical protein